METGSSSTIRNYSYEYFLKDHLTNVRVIFGDDGNGEAQILQEDHYYPYGMTLSGLDYNYGATDSKYLYQGKELQEDHGLLWHDFGARMYDAQLGRWHCQDPLEQFHSPYLAMGNDPVNGTDPTGMWFEPPPPRLRRLAPGESGRTGKYTIYRVKVRGHWVDGWSFYINHLRALKNGQVWDGKLMLFRESISHPVDLLPGAYGTTFDGICEQVRMQWAQTIEMEKQARRRELFEKKTLAEIYTLIQEIASGKKKENEKKVTEEELQAEISKLNAKIMDAASMGMNFTPGPGDVGEEVLQKGNDSAGDPIIWGLSIDATIAVIGLGQSVEAGIYVSNDGQEGSQYISSGHAAGWEASLAFNISAIFPMEGFQLDDLKGDGISIAWNFKLISVSFFTNVNHSGYPMQNFKGTYLGLKIGIGPGFGGSLSNMTTSFLNWLPDVSQMQWRGR